MKAGITYLKEHILRFAIPVLFLLCIWFIMASPTRSEWYANHIYPVVARLLSSLSGWVPFSLGDCFIYGSIAGLILYIIIRIIRRASLIKTFQHVLLYLCWVYIWFYLAWGLNYFRPGFFNRTRIPYIAYTPESFDQFLTTYTETLNNSYVVFDSIDKKVVAEEVQKGYDRIHTRFGMTAPSSRQEAKYMLFSEGMSKVGVLGYVGPFFNEFNLNKELLPVQYPSTYAHEMAHVLGIANEAEANLYGYLVCIQSGIPEIRFAGYFSIFHYVLGNAYSLLEKEDFIAWRDRIRPEIKELYNLKMDYWSEKYSPVIGEIQDKVYHLFLQSNNIPSGRKNYSEVVSLLIACQEYL
ncbi:MAG: DUF3810 domain-containing protein [Tannerellaceae bacterium]|nr:DUF3810 domain-containing protein [Tannerellaceae bacterium]